MDSCVGCNKPFLPPPFIDFILKMYLKLHQPIY
nr:MAG TPA: zinc finger domain protein [Caudoviricetes sp.]